VKAKHYSFIAHSSPLPGTACWAGACAYATGAGRGGSGIRCHDVVAPVQALLGGSVMHAVQ
jgi:hypothetical protein